MKEEDVILDKVAGNLLGQNARWNRKCHQVTIYKTEKEAYEMNSKERT